MDYIKDLHELCETIYEAISEANEKIRTSGGKLTAGDVDYVDKLTHALKSIKAVISMDDDGYSERYSGDYRMTRKYPSRMRYSGRGYSRTGDLAEQLRGLVHDAPDERTRQEIKRLIDRVEQD